MKSLFSYQKFFILALIGFALIVLSCDDTVTPDNPATFTARITDNSGTGVANATIEALNVSNRNLIEKTNSDEDGNFTLSKLPSDIQSVLLRISHSDFKTYEENLNTIKNNTKGGSLPIILHNQDTCCGMIIIYTKDKKTEEALKEVQVKLSRGNTILRKNYTNADGKLVFENICKGEYWLRLAKDGYKVTEEDFKIEGCDTLTLVFGMESKSEFKDTCCNGSITIVAKDKATGNIINQGYVKLFRDGYPKQSKELKGEAVKFENLCEGKYTFAIISDNYKAIEFHVELECNKHIEVVKELERTQSQDTCCGQLTVVVKNKSDNEPLSYVEVKLAKGSNVVGRYKTDNNGKVVFTNLCEGEYWIRLAKDGFKVIEEKFELGECDTITLEFSMEAQSNDQDTCCNGKVKIYVKDKNTSQLINGATVKLWQGGTLKATKKTENGYVIFEGLCKGKWGVSIHHENYQAMEFNFEIECNAEKEFVQYLKPQTTTDTCYTAKLKLFVKDYSTGNAISGATVKIYLNDSLIAEGESNSEGYYIREGLKAPTTYMIVISKSGYKSKTFEIRFKECNAISETIKLEAE